MGKYSQRWSFFIGHLPGVVAVFLSGSHAQGKAKTGSDIDLFIIAKPGRIWTARFFVFSFLKLTRKMRSPKNTKNKFCPNHFITADTLEIQEKDAYSAHLFSHNKPLYDPNNIFIQFIKKNKGWIKEYGEEFKYPAKKLPRTSPPLPFGHLPLKRGRIETFFKNVQIKKIKKNPHYNLSGAKIILNDTELRFHPRPRNKKWEK